MNNDCAMNIAKKWQSVAKNIEKCVTDSSISKEYKDLSGDIEIFLKNTEQITYKDNEKNEDGNEYKNEDGNEYLDIIKYDKSNEDYSELDKYLDNSNSANSLHSKSKLLLIIIVDNMEDLYISKKYMKKQKHIRNCKKNNIQCEYIMVNNSKNTSINIGIDSRIKTIEQSIKIGSTDVHSYVFTANAVDIIEKLYNKIGPQLFNDNLRFHISEKNDVEYSIKDTLKNNCNQFWFLNNGISMTVQEVDSSWKQPTNLHLNLYYKNEDNKDKDNINISVINGAQTISTLAEYYYENKEYMQANQPKVLLRLYIVDSKDQQESNAFFKKITTSLNRQKPITTEDTYILNENIEEWNSSKSKQFVISKRGSDSGYINTSDNDVKNIELKLFLKLIAMFMGWPGTARSKSIIYIANKLSEADGDNKEGNGKYIFENICKNQEDQEDKKQESLINCIAAIEDIYNQYDSIIIKKNDRLEEDESKKEVFKNTKTLFVSFACYLAIYYDENGKKLDKEYEDISKSIHQLAEKLKNLAGKFEDAEEKLKDKEKRIKAEYKSITQKVDYYKVIEIFENAVEQLSDKDNKLDSNYFKKDDYYADFKIKVDTELKSM